MEKVIGTGEKLIDERHFNSKPIKDKCQELQLSWDDLLNKSKVRKKNLDISVQVQRVCAGYVKDKNEYGTNKA